MRQSCASIGSELIFLPLIFFIFENIVLNIIFILKTEFFTLNFMPEASASLALLQELSFYWNLNCRKVPGLRGIYSMEVKTNASCTFLSADFTDWCFSSCL